MNRVRRYRALAIGCLLLVGAAASAQAEHPQYWILGCQQPDSNVQYVHPQGYAYGWFGAQARPQASRQTGYYGLYRQWTFR